MMDLNAPQIWIHRLNDKSKKMTFERENWEETKYFCLGVPLDKLNKLLLSTYFLVQLNY